MDLYGPKVTPSSGQNYGVWHMNYYLTVEHRPNYHQLLELKEIIDRKLSSMKLRIDTIYLNYEFYTNASNFNASVVQLTQWSSW